MKVYSAKEIWGLSRDNWRKNGFIAYLIFFFAILLVCGVSALNLLVPFFFYMVVPFVVLPIFFATQASIYLLRDAEQLTLGGFFRCFFGYFSEHFRSTFRAIKSFLFSLIFYGSVYVVSFIVSFIIFYTSNLFGFKDLLSSIRTTSLMSFEDLDYLFETYSKAIEMFGICTSLPSFTIFSFVFIYLCSKNSVSMFFRLSNYKLTGRFFSEVQTVVMKRHTKLYLKYYWTLNWPLFLLLLLGFTLGSYVGYLYQLSYVSLYAFGLMFALFFAYFFYGPTYLANKEAIYVALKDAYEEETIGLSNVIASSMEDLLNKIKSLEENNTDNNNDEES